MLGSDAIVLILGMPVVMAATLEVFAVVTELDDWDADVVLGGTAKMTQMLQGLMEWNSKMPLDRSFTSFYFTLRDTKVTKCTPIPLADLHSKILDAHTPAPPPLPRRPNSFNFMQLLAEFGKIVCSCPLEGSRPHLGEILDPPLYSLIW